ncbi:MAG TPA: glycosyltransferase family 2 protein [Flavipsychrobacter sp.]|nr:glycosyltransferase family 2 protein [Flavipsychrobacter sp.]
MPAYRAALTLERTLAEVPMDIVDEIVLVDDKSPDDTVEVARHLGIRHIVEHQVNKGYGGNQKSCYAKALELGADIVVMLHPDYQYTPKLIHAMAGVIAYDVYPVCFGSRILGKGALKGGMPMYKYISNRFLTWFENVLIGQKLSEYHTGYRAFTAEVIRSIDFSHNSDDFVFDNEMISQIFMNGYEIGEVTCPTKYFEEASSINFSRSMKYGRGVLRVSLVHMLHKAGIIKSKLYGSK